MQICCGMIGWTPETFWTSSLLEVFIAMDGFKEFNTTKNDDPLDRDELNKLMELYPD